MRFHFDIARLNILFVARLPFALSQRQRGTAHRQGRIAREHGDTVVGFLGNEGCMPSRPLQNLERKAFLRTLELLQQREIDLAHLQEIEKGFQPFRQRVDIESDDPHETGSQRRQRARV